MVVGDVTTPLSVSNSNRLPIILTPVLALVGAAALIALVAWLAGWYRNEMLLVAVGSGGVVAPVTIAALYAQARQQHASNAGQGTRVEVRFPVAQEAA